MSTGYLSRTRGVQGIYFSKLLAYVLLILWILFALLPVAWVYVSSIKQASDVFVLPPKIIFEPTPRHYQEVLNLLSLEEQTGMARSTFPRSLLNSIIVSLGTTTVSLPIGALAAYALTRFRIPGKQYWLAGVIISQLIPPIVLLVPIYVVWQKFRLIDTHYGLILAYTTFTLPFVIWVMRAFFLDIPLDLEEAAYVDGCTRWGAFRRILLPLAAPGLAVTAIFVIIATWNEFLLASILTGRTAMTVSPAILGFITDKAILWGRLYAASSTILLPVIAFTLSLQRYLASGLSGGAVKG